METDELKLLIKALAFASACHRNQRRKDRDASPYINHPIALTDVLVNEGQVTDPETLCAALLHDVIEDTEATEAELAVLFGPTITAIVIEVTDDESMDKRARKQAQIERAPLLSVQAKAIKLADKIANLRDVVANPPPDWSHARRREYFDWAKQVIDGLRGDHPHLEEVFDAQFAERP
ncbi:MAG: bifunctional (p)ppGpp synthetase/guanosine-3',5'-bis(diphosphate) 3'-pyrophosphohydrolase [Gammaproteobacteria bacterium]|nr:bifunctional (p)ppGpp synthetase/guanosine-3',5'-bis(diphosphate) 3'-pyrophosphohydrolase [Gammaproteobacteria bacterium]